MNCNNGIPCMTLTLQWRHNGHYSVSNHQPRDCLLNRLFRRSSKKTSKLSVTGLCAGNSPGTGEFPAQMASNAENVSIWWRHHCSQQSTSCERISRDVSCVLRVRWGTPLWHGTTHNYRVCITLRTSLALASTTHPGNKCTRKPSYMASKLPYVSQETH